MALFAATLRMITSTKAEAEWWAEIWRKEYCSNLSLKSDGTVQIFTEEQETG